MAKITVDFYSLHWNNIDERILENHKKIMKFFDIPMNYHNLDRVSHGHWMQWVVENSEADVVVFFEPDCIPLNKKYLEYITYCYQYNTFIGIAQVSNHIPPKSHIYAGPGFYCISKNAFNTLKKPNFCETARSDVAEEVSYKAENIGLKYRALMPTYFEKEPEEGVWPLSNLGYYGIGTVYDNSVYHLFQSRYAQNIKMFINRCEQILNNTFTTEGMYNTTLFNYQGKIVS